MYINILACKFLFLINDIAVGILDNIRLFADGTTLFAIVDNDISLPLLCLFLRIMKK